MKTQAMALIAVTMLSACGHSASNRARLDVRPIGAVAAAQPSEALSDGRARLLRGEIAGAIAAYRLALQEPASAAQANNGLGAAYAMLGKPDVATRYFERAIELDPRETKYVDNLARLQRAQAAALVTGLGASPSAVVSSTAVTAPSDNLASEFDRTFAARLALSRPDRQAPRAGMIRVSAREVQIRLTPLRPETTGVRQSRNLAAIPPRTIRIRLDQLPHASAGLQ